MKYFILSLAVTMLFSLQGYAKQQEPNISSTTGSSTTIVIIDNENQQAQDDTPVKSKSFTKSFIIDRNDKINLSNQYGSITIRTWDRNEIKVDADLSAYAKTENEAQRLLDDVSISANKIGDLVSYKTEMVSKNRSWGSNVKNGKTIWRREVKINYTVYMPVVNALTASQQYGNILMGDFSGPTAIKIQYGNLTAGNLNNVNNYLSIQYGKGDIKNMGGADIKHQYGNGLTIGTISNTLNLNAQYTAVKIAAVKGAGTVKHQYGAGTTIGTVTGDLNVNTQYCTIKIGNLQGNLISKAQYGTVIIDGIEADRHLDIDAQYTSVNLSFAQNYNSDFSISTSYGSFKYGANVTARILGDGEKNNSSSKKYAGQIGKGGLSRVIVKSSYGAVTFK